MSTRPDPIVPSDPQPATAPGARPPTFEFPQPVPGLDDTRGFGAHLRMSWWKALIIILVPLLVMLVAQFILTFVVVIIEVAAFGRDPMSVEMTPLMMLAANVSLALMGPLAVLLTAWLAKVPWRRVISSPRRPSLGRWGLYLAGFAALVLVALGLTMLIAPSESGLGRFGVTSTTVGLILVAVLTTPLQAAGEELTFRGAILPAVGSWFRSARVALVVGLLVSSMVFALVHFSVDPWLLTYYTVFGVSMALMAMITRGLEAPIAFHIGNNLILMVLGALFAGGGSVEMDRSVGVGGPFMLIFIAVDVAAVALVWLDERRRARISA